MKVYACVAYRQAPRQKNIDADKNNYGTTLAASLI